MKPQNSTGPTALANGCFKIPPFAYPAKRHLPLLFLPMQGPKVRPTPDSPTYHRFEITRCRDFFLPFILLPFHS